MKKQLLLLLLGCSFNLLLNAQNITKVEYFFNTDPGFGNGINVPITSSTNVSTSFSPNISLLADGTHFLYVRSANANGNWSSTNNRVFYKTNLTTSNVSKLEYFFDTDPGFENGINVPITSSSNVSTTFLPNISSLADGTHFLYIRSADVNGKWSSTNTSVFYKTNLTTSNVSKLEYFFDTDPGFGNGINVPITSSSNVSTTFSPNMASLTQGTHFLYVRSADANGKWSITNTSVFYKTNLSFSNISKLEYFIDTDPGFGRGINVPITPATNISNLVFAVNTTSLVDGIHRLYVRSLSVDGNWCITNVSSFTKSAALPLNLLSFNALLQNNKVLTQWQTTNEVNVSHMNVQRSIDGSNFSFIGKVDATGIGSYNFTDATLPTNTKTIYYRLEIVDINGNKQFSKVVAVLLAKSNLAVTVYPNPTKDILFVSMISTKQEYISIQVTDLQGKVLQTKNLKLSAGSNSFNITTSALSKGAYVLVIGGEFVQQKIFIKE